MLERALSCTFVLVYLDNCVLVFDSTSINQGLFGSKNKSSTDIFLISSSPNPFIPIIFI